MLSDVVFSASFYGGGWLGVWHGITQRHWITNPFSLTHNKNYPTSMLCNRETEQHELIYIQVQKQSWQACLLAWLPNPNNRQCVNGAVLLGKANNNMVAYWDRS